MKSWSQALLYHDGNASNHFVMAPCFQSIAMLSLPLLLVLGSEAAASSTAPSRVEVSSDNGGTWHDLASTDALSVSVELPPPSPAGGVFSARAPGVFISLPSAVATSENSCVSVTLRRWVTVVGGVPFALGWTRSPSVARRRCSKESPVEVRTVEADVKAVKPRWAAYVRRFSVEDAREAEELAAAGGSGASSKSSTGLRGWWARWNKMLLPFALFAVVALAHGIYLGVTAIEEDEAADIRAREERLLRRVTGQPEPRPAAPVAAPRPSKKKRKGKQ